MSSSNPSRHVVIVGAGVAGLSIALALLDHPKSTYTVTVISEHLPGNESDLYPATYSSMWAGAHHVSDAQTDRELQWDQRTFDVMQRLCERKPWKKITSITTEPLIWVNQTELWSTRPSESSWKALNWYPDFKNMDDSQLPMKCAAGCTFSTYDIHVPSYMAWLSSEVVLRGGKLVRAKLRSLKEISALDGKKADLIVTAVGLGAKDLDEIEDDQMDASRGQVLLINAPWAKTEGELYPWSGLSRVGNEGFRDVYVIPRGDNTFVVGGTRLKGDWDGNPRCDTTREILERVLIFAPQLRKPGSNSSEVDLISTNVGLRPVREGGPRLELGEDVGVAKVVHAYGFGGFGYQSSFGFAFEARDLIDSSLSLPSAGKEKLFRNLF